MWVGLRKIGNDPWPRIRQGAPRQRQTGEKLAFDSSSLQDSLDLLTGDSDVIISKDQGSVNTSKF